MYIFGRLIGFGVFLVMIKGMRATYGRLKCKYFHTENIQKLNGQSFIVVANHIKPHSKFLRAISMPYDAYMLRRMFQLQGIKITALTSFDSYSVSKNRFYKFLDLRVKTPLLKGIVKSCDLIPLNRKSHDKATSRTMNKFINKGKIAIGIFPEGTWFNDYNKDRKLQAGTGVLSKRYDLPVLPVFINAYDLKDGVPEIRVGQPIFDVSVPSNVMNSIKEQFTNMSAGNPQPALA